jgi:DNA-binding NarL/FixJ family response regulator
MIHIDSPLHTRVLTIDEHPLLREGVAALIGTQPDMLLVGHAASVVEGLSAFRIHQPDVTVIDAQMRDGSGADAITAIRGEYPQARIVALAARAGDVVAARALKAGATAYLLKNAPPQELLEAIRSARSGRRHVSSQIAIELARHLTDDDLTAREIQILRHVALGDFDKRIADKLCLSIETVKSHLKHARSKLGATTRTHAVSIAVRRGIFEL